MSIDEHLADRVRATLSHRGVEWEEKRMFGALVFMVGGAIAVGVRGGGGLLVRCDPDEGAALLREVGPASARRARMGEREMGPNWFDVSLGAADREGQLDLWVDAALRR